MVNDRKKTTKLNVPQEILLELGSSLREQRRKRGISQEELAALTAIDRSYISDIERGVSSPTLLVLLRLTEAMDIKLWRLVKRIQG